MFTDYSNDDSFTEGVYDLDQELNNDESVYNSLTQQEKELISQKVQNEFSEMKKKRDQLMTSATPKESDENEKHQLLHKVVNLQVQILQIQHLLVVPRQLQLSL